MPEAERLIPTARHEPEDISERFAWGAVASLTALLVGCALLVWWLYPPSRSNVALVRPLPVYPAPRLQTSPSADMTSFHAEEMQRLNGAGWVDRAKGTLHIPIDEAMRKVAEEGIPGWPATPEQTSAPSPEQRTP
jgi:hypothetical protein